MTVPHPSHGELSLITPELRYDPLFAKINMWHTPKYPHTIPSKDNFSEKDIYVGKIVCIILQAVIRIFFLLKNAFRRFLFQSYPYPSGGPGAARRINT